MPISTKTEKIGKHTYIIRQMPALPNGAKVSRLVMSAIARAGGRGGMEGIALILGSNVTCSECGVKYDEFDFIMKSVFEHIVCTDINLGTTLGEGPLMEHAAEHFAGEYGHMTAVLWKALAFNMDFLAESRSGNGLSPSGGSKNESNENPNEAATT